jgi:HD-GYP domain-containing protein (c-di-GMP phosphodiesterase class II)
VEAQISHPLTAKTRHDARAALARAFEEAAVMPGTLLPHEIIEELTEVAGRIVEEVTAEPAELPSKDERLGPWGYIVEHSMDATVVGLQIGRRLLPPESMDDLGFGLFLQDIGMLALPEAVVQKPGALEPGEWELLTQHPLLGLQFLRDDTIGNGAKAIVRSHHERWDGSGYPNGLVSEEASLFARIAAVADAFDAMTSDRYHARAIPPDVAAEVIRAGSGTDFDPAVVEAFAALV